MTSIATIAERCAALILREGAAGNSWHCERILRAEATNAGLQCEEPLLALVAITSQVLDHG
jgi:hypothetical protein